MKGAKPKPTAIKRLEQGPRRRSTWDRPDEPKPTVGEPPMPSGLSALGQEIWKTQSEVFVNMGVLTVADGAVFAAYCETSATYYAALQQMNLVVQQAKAEGKYIPYDKLFPARIVNALVRIAAEIGATPSGRARLRVEPGTRARKADDWDALDEL